jgi:beta-galactosidase/beta-glucuronidase
MKKALIQGTVFRRVAAVLAIGLALAGNETLFAGMNGGRDSATIDLSGSWLMKDFTRGIGVARQAYLPGNQPRNCLPIEIPGTVRTALLAAGEIPDPYVGYDNEKSLWVEQKEWWFFKAVKVGSELKGKWVDLVFEGTSFRGEVWLNGHPVGDLKGMLNSRAFDVSRILNYGGDNWIAVRLEAPPDSWDNTMARGLTWRTPRDQLYSIAQCMYGWDWGPHCVGIGIWQPVKLRVSGALRTERPAIRTQIPSAQQAVCTVELTVQNVSDQEAKGTLSGVIVEKGSGRPAAEFQQIVTLAPGKSQTLSATVAIQDPKLWWPNGMGDQPLYLLRAEVSVGSTVSDRMTTQFGIRELKLVENEHVQEFLDTMKENLGDAHHLGNVLGSYPWTFEINGKKMFAKGGNWIPVDQLLRLDRSRYAWLLKLVRDAHFNLLRVWGGGLYETDDFYDLCDEYGILAWQEFLSNRNFAHIDRENFLDGARSAIYRLRNHPSLTFWCGGNEFDPDDAGSKAVIDALGALLQECDPQREFHRASPYMGDDHYWGVWHHKEPYTAYRVVRPFRSEAGLNAPPVAEDYRKFTPEPLLWPPDPTYVEYHGESNTRFAHLDKLLRYANEFGPSAGIDELIMKGQLYQALGNAFDMEFCRAHKFRNSGFLVWQFNDIWPCLSWSVVDWYGTPKASYYFMKRASRPVHISADYARYLWKGGEKFSAEVYLLNDTEQPVRGCTYRASLLDVAGKPITQISGPAEVEANRSARIGVVEFPIPLAMAGKTFFVAVELSAPDGKRISDALYPIAVSKTGDLEDFSNIFAGMRGMPEVKLEVTSAGEGAHRTVQIANPAGALAYFVRVRLTEESATLKPSFSDNYIALLPGERATIAMDLETGEGSRAPSPLHVEVSGWNCPKQMVEIK